MAGSSFDLTAPAGSRNANEIDNAIRELKTDLDDRLALGGHRRAAGTTNDWDHMVLETGDADEGNFRVLASNGDTAIRVRSNVGADAEEGLGFKLKAFKSIYIPGSLAVNTYYGPIIEIPWGALAANPIVLPVQIRAAVVTAPSGGNCDVTFAHWTNGEDVSNTSAATLLDTCTVSVGAHQGQAAVTAIANLQAGDMLRVKTGGSVNNAADLTLSLVYAIYEDGNS